MVLTFLFLVSCQQNADSENKASPKDDLLVSDTTIGHVINTGFVVNILNTSDDTYGYDILKNGKLYIHQPHIPGIAGVKGFSTKEKSQKAAEFIIYKIKNNIIPPTVSKEELDSLNLLN